MSLLDLCLLDSHKVQHSSLLVWTSIKSCDGPRLDNISFPKFHLILFLWTVRDEKAYESGTDVVRPLIHITQNSTARGWGIAQMLHMWTQCIYSWLKSISSQECIVKRGFFLLTFLHPFLEFSFSPKIFDFSWGDINNVTSRADIMFWNHHQFNFRLFFKSCCFVFQLRICTIFTTLVSFTNST